MDLLTQLDSDIDLLLQIMSSSVAFISRKAKHSPLPSSSIPLTILGKTEAISPAEMEDAIGELVSDLVEKASSIREIILHLPTEGSLGGEVELQSDLRRVEEEMEGVNREYRAAVEEVKALKGEVRELVLLVEQAGREGRAWLVEELEAPKRGAIEGSSAVAGPSIS